jgi:hypothetical protein
MHTLGPLYNDHPQQSPATNAAVIDAGATDAIPVPASDETVLDFEAIMHTMTQTEGEKVCPVLRLDNCGGKDKRTGGDTYPSEYRMESEYSKWAAGFKLAKSGKIKKDEKGEYVCSKDRHNGPGPSSVKDYWAEYVLEATAHGVPPPLGNSSATENKILKLAKDIAQKFGTERLDASTFAPWEYLKSRELGGKLLSWKGSDAWEEELKRRGKAKSPPGGSSDGTSAAAATATTGAGEPGAPGAAADGPGATGAPTSEVGASAPQDPAELAGELKRMLDDRNREGETAGKKQRLCEVINRGINEIKQIIGSEQSSGGTKYRSLNSCSPGAADTSSSSSAVYRSLSLGYYGGLTSAGASRGSVVTLASELERLLQQHSLTPRGAARAVARVVQLKTEVELA